MIGTFLSAVSIATYNIHVIYVYIILHIGVLETMQLEFIRPNTNK